MRERLPVLGFVSGLALLAAAVVVGSYAVGTGLEGRNAVREDTIAVTGSAKARIDSDYVIWDASVSSQQPTPDAAAVELDRFTTSIEAFLRTQGVAPAELTTAPVTTEAVRKGDGYNDNGKLLGYRLTRTFEVRSSRVQAVARTVERSSTLLAQGIPIESQPLQYVFTKLASIRPALLAAATRDALERARVLVGAAGSRLGGLRGVEVGVFQVTSPNSTDVSGDGIYDTSTFAKDVTAVVNVTFSLRPH